MLTEAELPNAVFLDTETTGLGYEDQIVEIAIIDHHGRALLETLVRPTVPISAEAQAVHGITADDVATAPTFAEILPHLAAALLDRHLVIYNRDFDLRMLAQTLAAHGLLAAEGSLHQRLDEAFAPRAYHCAMLAYAEFWGGWNYRRKSYRWQSLTTAARQQHCRLPAGLRAHRARADAELTRQLVLKMIAQTRCS